MFGYMEMFYIRASFGRLLLTKVKLPVWLKILGEKFVISKILHLSLQRDFKVITSNISLTFKFKEKMNGLRLSQADTKKPDMKGWSDYRKADYEKTQRLLKMRWSK